MSAIRQAAAAIGGVHRDAGRENPCRHPGVRRTLAGIARQAAAAGRAAPRQAAALDAEALAAIRATARRPRRGSRRGETAEKAERRGRVDIALAHLLSDAGLRRSEAAALPWADIARAADGSGRVTVRRSKTDQAGQGAILYVTAATMTALAAIRQGAPDAAPVFGLSAGQIGRRIAAAATAAGLGAGYSGHSGRVGLAVRMTAKGAPTHAVMLAGRWQGAGMVARYTRSLTAADAARYL